MHGENRAKVVRAMRSFKDWAMRVVAGKEGTGMVVPTQRGFAASIEAYNDFASQYNSVSKDKLKHFRSIEQLEGEMMHYRKELYKGSGAIVMKKSRFFLLPNRF
ncbi:MAG: hypothetical protein KGH49_03795 [Candidatus Micrarchaeota archaeon]|nr:hypothetical protein [Candidatus Micrarchaeota archaeon]